MDAALRTVPEGCPVEAVEHEHLPRILAEVAVVLAKKPDSLVPLLHTIVSWKRLGLGYEELRAAYRSAHECDHGGSAGTSGRADQRTSTAQDDEAHDADLLAQLERAIERSKKAKGAIALAEEHGGFDDIPVRYLGDLLGGAGIWDICAGFRKHKNERQARIELKREFRKLTDSCLQKNIANKRLAERREYSQQTLKSYKTQWLRIDSGHPEHQAVDEGLKFLANDPDLYVQRAANGDSLVAVRPSTMCGVIVRPISEAGVADRVSRFAKVVAVDAAGGIKAAHVPKWLSQLVRDRGHYPGFRRLVGVTTVPMLGPDGWLIGFRGRGFDEKSGYYYAPDQDYLLPGRVSFDEARAAGNRILDYVREFPWAPAGDWASRSAWFAGLLTTFVRPAIRGPCPFFVCDGNLRGVGKTLLVKMIGLARLGRQTPLLKWSKEEELQKSLLATLRGGPAIINIDNLRGYIESLTLEALLTSQEFRCRMLGSNTDAIIDPMHSVIFGTANNAVLSPDLVRRAIPIRLETDCESPEKRDFDRKELEGEVQANRKQIVEDVLRCIVGYVEAGCPSVPLSGAFGSYEGWTIVRRICVWLGLPDPVVAREGWNAAAQDNDAESITVIYRAIEVISAQHVVDGSGGSHPRGFATASLLHRLMTEEAASPAQAVADGYVGLHDALVEMCNDRAPGPQKIGRALRRLQDAPFGGRRLRARDDGHKILQWWIEAKATTT